MLKVLHEIINADKKPLFYLAEHSVVGVSSTVVTFMSQGIQINKKYFVVCKSH